MKIGLAKPEIIDSEAEDDAWFRVQVQEALDGFMDGKNTLISDAEWR